jgi:ATP-binding cassette subfamily B protein/ATP-binding cassette subfamily C protein
VHLPVGIGRQGYQQHFHLLAKYLWPQWKWVAALALVLLSHITLQLVNPQILGYFIDTLASGETPDRLVSAGILFMGVALLTQGLMVGVVYLSEIVAWTATNALRVDLVEHCLKLDLSFHKSRTPGEWLERVDGDVTVLSRFFSQFVIHLLGNCILLVGILGVLWRENPSAGLGLSLFSCAALLLLVRLRGMGVAAWGAYRQISADFFGFIGEKVAALEDLRANGATRYVRQKFYQYLRKWIRIWQQARFTSTILWASSVGLFTVANAIALAIGAYLWAEQAASIGSIYLIFHYTNLLVEPIERIREELEQFQEAEASITRIQELLQINSRLPQGGSQQLRNAALSIRFEDVWFQYPDSEQQEWALQGISFSLPPGQILGLLGRTGSGKSSLSRLLMRLYDPQHGMIYVDGIPLSRTPLGELPQHFSLVTQDVQLFQSTIRNNLTLFNPHIKEEQILAVLDLLGLSEWLHTYPHGLDTLLGSQNSSLSAGQAQLLAFARAFLKDPGVVILDEASSRLDPMTERLVEHATQKLLQGRTGVIIAHRLQTVERADQILILEQGRILEYGSRRILASNKSSRYFQLCRAGLADAQA